VTNLPYNQEAERYVLSALLQFPDKQGEILDCLQVDDFFSEKHKIIFQAMSDLSHAKEIIDLVTVTDKADIKFPKAGSYLAEITDLAITSECQAQIKILLEHTALRESLLLCRKSMDALSRCNGNAVDVIDNLQTQFLRLGVRGTKQEFFTMRQLMDESYDRYKKNMEGHGKGIKTGYFLLDQATGGLRGSKFIVLAGRPGQGKTTLAMNVLNRISEDGIPAGFFSLEMDREEINDRQVSQVSGVNSVRLTKEHGLNTEDWQRITSAASKISEWPLLIDDDGGLTVSEIKRRSRLMVKQGAQIIFIDQLSKIQGRGKDRWEKAANVVNELSLLPKELRVPVVLLAQINREADKNKGKNIERMTHKPGVWMLKDTGTLEEDADIILIIYRPWEYTRDPQDECFANLEIAKHRGGPCIDVPLFWDGKRFTFKDQD
jgi:replicative DNA helicase